MSTTIYNGLKAVKSDPFEVATDLRAVLVPEWHARFGRLIDLATADGAHENPLGQIVGLSGSRWKKPARRFALPQELHRAVSELHQSSEYTFSPYAIGYDVALIPNMAGGEPLVLVYGEQAESYRELLLQAGVVTAYGYWDNTDPDEDATEEEWKTRRKAWEAIYDESPSAAGLHFTFPSSLDAAVAAQKR